MSDMTFNTSLPLNSGSASLVNNSNSQQIGSLDSNTKTTPKDSNSMLALFNSSHISSVGIDVHNNKMVLAFQRSLLESNGLETDMFTTCADITSLNKAVNWISEKAPEVIIMESTGVYWVPLYNILEDKGYAPSTHVLNASDVKVMSGHKSDKTDAQHLASIGRLGTFKSSFIPTREIREMRIISRQIFNIKRDCAKEKCRLHKLLCIKGFKASNVFSNISGPTAQTILDGVMRGLTGAELYKYIEENKGRLHASTDEIMEALQYTDINSIKPLYYDIVRQIDFYQMRIEELSQLLDEHLKPYQHELELLKSIPGINDRIAKILISELGTDYSRFITSKHFCSWVGLAPGNKESAGHRINVGITQGNRYIRKALIEAAQSIGKMRGGYLHLCFKRFKQRMSYNKAVTALAHKLLRIIYAIVTTNKPYHEPNYMGSYYILIEEVNDVLLKDPDADAKETIPATANSSRSDEAESTVSTDAKEDTPVKAKRTRSTKAKSTESDEAESTVSTDAKEATPVKAKRTRSTKAKSTESDEAESTVSTDAKEATPVKAKRTRSTKAKSTESDEAESTVSTDAKEATPVKAKRTRSTKAKSIESDEAESTVSTDAKEAIPVKAKRTRSTKAKSTESDEAESTVSTDAKEATPVKAKRTRSYKAKSTKSDEAESTVSTDAKEATPVKAKRARSYKAKLS